MHGLLAGSTEVYILPVLRCDVGCYCKHVTRLTLRRLEGPVYRRVVVSGVAGRWPGDSITVNEVLEGDVRRQPLSSKRQLLPEIQRGTGPLAQKLSYLVIISRPSCPGTDAEFDVACTLAVLFGYKVKRLSSIMGWRSVRVLLVPVALSHRRPILLLVYSIYSGMFPAERDAWILAIQHCILHKPA